MVKPLTGLKSSMNFGMDLGEDQELNDAWGKFYPDQRARPSFMPSELMMIVPKITDRSLLILYKVFYCYKKHRLQSGKRHLNFDCFQDFFINCADYGCIEEFEAVADEEHFEYPMNNPLNIPFNTPQ